MSNKKISKINDEIEPEIDDEEKEDEDEEEFESEDDESEESDDDESSDETEEDDDEDEEEDDLGSSSEEGDEEEELEAEKEEDEEVVGKQEKDEEEKNEKGVFKVNKKTKKSKKSIEPSSNSIKSKLKKRDEDIGNIDNIIDDLNIEDDDNDDDDTDYLQKFDESIRKNIIQQYHPEMIIKNNAEIETLSKVVRDSNGNIIDPFHKTIPFLTKYEKARIIGERANQINEGSPIFVKVEKDVIDGYLIALKEFEERKIPFIIQRPLPNGNCEYWRLQDLEIL